MPRALSCAAVLFVSALAACGPTSPSDSLTTPDAGVPVGTAFSTVMRIYRAGGFMKDAIYLRGLLDLLQHVRDGGSLDLFYLGKFSLEDLPLIEDLHKRGLTEPPCVSPRYLADPRAFARIREAAEAEDLTTLVNDPPPTDPTN